MKGPSVKLAPLQQEAALRLNQSVIPPWSR